MTPLDAAIERWLRAFAAAVRARSYRTAAEQLVDPAILAFGTVASRAEGVAELRDRQWHLVWESTSDFDFDYASARAEVVGDRAWVAALWTSHGTKAPLPTERAGRATIILARTSAGWRAIHTHFSTSPAQPEAGPS